MLPLLGLAGLRRGLATLVLAGNVAGAAGYAATYSALWGERGEAWEENGRLPDYSYAGYRQGETPLPVIEQVTNVRDFGAKGDGVTDDTKAIQRAIEATKRGAIFLPPGRYPVSDFLRITRSQLVLRGAGPSQSVLIFARGLDEVHPKSGRTSTGDPASGYSFDGAFLTLQGDYRARSLGKITAVARRGDHAVQVDRPGALKVGQRVLVVAREDAAQTLKTYLYAGDPGEIKKGKPLDTKMLLRVTAVHGTTLTFDRPLRFETRAEWQPEIRAFEPTVTESGVEELGFEFPGRQYGGHFKELGANAIELREVNNCWVRNVAVHNGDFGVNVVACGNTLEGVTFTADASRDRMVDGTACTGHHAIQCKNAEDNLVTRFDVRTSYVHDLTVEHASGNVFALGRGDNLALDHHKDTPYGNLFTSIDAGRGLRVWRCGGGPALGRQSASWETFWALRAAVPLEPPAKGWGAPGMNFVGFPAKAAHNPGASGTWWIEAVAPAQLEPGNLYASQLARRLSATSLAAQRQP